MAINFMQEHFLDEKIYYRKNEFKDGRPTLVFVHGVSGSSSVWWPYEKIFENSYNILTYDIRGHGASKKYPYFKDYELKNFTTDLHELLSSLDISKFILFSNSFGSLIALEYLKLYRDTVIANIFASPEVFVERNWVNKLTYGVLKTLSFVLRFLPFNPKPRGHVDYSRHRGSTDWDVARNIADMRNTGFRAHCFSLTHSFSPHIDYALEKINVPTLVIHGEKDTMVLIGNALLVSKKIKNAEFISIPNIDHNTAHNAVKEMSLASESFIIRHKLLE